MADKQDWIAIDDVANILKTTRLNVLMQIKRGYLQGELAESGWCVARASLDAYLATSPEERPQAVCQSGCAKASGCGGCH